MGVTMTNQSIVPGSLAAVANRARVSLAESFLSCEVICLIDQSGSMSAKDAPGGRSRFDAAADELMNLQTRHPGQVAVVAFSTTVEFCPGGVPNREGGTTDMARALRFVQVADGASQIVLISDGLPDREAAARVAARQFRHPIHTIYIGPENDREGGRAFLARLAAETGGRVLESDAPGLLAAGVAQLLLSA